MKMMHLCHLLCVVIIVLQPMTVYGLFGWFVSSGKSSEQTKDYIQTEVSFELAGTDERFLEEVKKFAIEESNDSALGNCHSRLVLSLKQSCTTLSPEEIGKVAVNLLNCQNAIEERRQFPCSGSMSLAECTRDMDATSWTVYQLMSNRALAVCHSVGQKLFRARTELLVNRLAEASEKQVGQLQDMHKWHDKLRDLQVSADARMNSLSAQHDVMASNQEALLRRQKELEQALDTSSRHLLEENEQLTGSTRSILTLTSEVRSRLDATVDEVKRQEMLLQNQHSDMQKTIRHYEKSMQGLLDTLEMKGEGMLAVQEETFVRVHASLEGVQKVNNSISAIGARLLSIQEDISGYIEWIQANILGQHELSSLCIHHVIIMFVLMGLAAFLHFPICSRIVIIVVVPANIYLSLTSEFHATPLELLFGIACVCAVDVVVEGWPCSRKKPQPVSQDEVRQLIDTIKSIERRIEDISVNSPARRTSTFNVPDSDLSTKNNTFNWEPLMAPISPQEWDRVSIAASDISSGSTFSKRGSLSSRQRCEAVNRNGSQCKRFTSSVRCGTHRRQLTS